MFLLSKVEAWTADDGAFNLEEFFNEVVGLFELRNILIVLEPSRLS